MYHTGWIALGLAGLVGGGAIAALPVLAQERISSYLYGCDAGKRFRADYYADQAVLSFPDGSPQLTLPQVVSASGSRYSDGQTTLYTQGIEAFIETGSDRPYANCVALNRPAPATPEPIPGLW